MSRATPIGVGRAYDDGTLRVRVTDVWKPEGARGGAPRTHWITYRSLADGLLLPDYLPGSACYGAMDERRCNATQFRQWFRPV